MQRWVLVRDGIVRGYMFSENEPSEDRKRLLVFGDMADAGDLAPEGEWHVAPDSAGLVGDDWQFDGKVFSPPMR
jgi:hypothetical protein